MAVAQWSGGVSTPFGGLDLQGLGDAAGQYSLRSRPGVVLRVGEQDFTADGVLVLTRGGVDGAGRLGYGRMELSGSVRVPSGGGAASFSGVARGETTPKAFGTRAGGGPGHPYAWVTWNVSGVYDPAVRRVGATVSGTLTVESEVLRPGGLEYPRQGFGFGPVAFGVDGQLTLTPGEVFNGVGTFGFGLP
jgi:hypothetical protein